MSLFVPLLRAYTQRHQLCVPEKLAITCASRELLRTPHPFHVFLNNSHPPLDDRLKAIRDYYGKYYNERMWACWSNQGEKNQKDRKSRSIRAFAEHSPSMLWFSEDLASQSHWKLPFHSKLHYTLCKRLVEARCLRSEGYCHHCKVWVFVFFFIFSNRPVLMWSIVNRMLCLVWRLKRGATTKHPCRTLVQRQIYDSYDPCLRRWTFSSLVIHVGVFMGSVHVISRLKAWCFYFAVLHYMDWYILWKQSNLDLNPWNMK